jgi:hypothetical protein
VRGYMVLFLLTDATHCLSASLQFVIASDVLLYCHIRRRISGNMSDHLKLSKK